MAGVIHSLDTVFVIWVMEEMRKYKSLYYIFVLLNEVNCRSRFACSIIIYTRFTILSMEHVQTCQVFKNLMEEAA